MIPAALLLAVTTALNAASNTLVSRARNSKSLRFHVGASILSNGVWLLVLRQVVQHLDNGWMLTAYMLGAVSGSVAMHWLSMHHIEHRIGATP